jgi:hypothetical protein
MTHCRKGHPVMGPRCLVCHRERNARSRRHLAREAELDRLEALRLQRSKAGKASWAVRKGRPVGK